MSFFWKYRYFIMYVFSITILFTATLLGEVQGATLASTVAVLFTGLLGGGVANEVARDRKDKPGCSSHELSSGG